MWRGRTWLLVRNGGASVSWPLKVVLWMLAAALISLLSWVLDRPVPEIPSRPATVPVDAKWSGDGNDGVWVRCGFDSERDVNPCEVFENVTGELISTGDYVLAIELRAATPDELRYTFRGGMNLGTGQRLVPVETLVDNSETIPGGYRERILSALARFRSIDDTHRRNATFLTTVPSEGPSVYLNILFMPALPSIRASVSKELNVPEPLTAFYAELNGAFLLRTVFIFGLRPSSGFLYARDDAFGAMPYSLRRIDPGPSPFPLDQFEFGSYWQDGSQLTINRNSGEVTCYFGKDPSRVRQNWASFDDWLFSELDRLSPMFDSVGNPLVPAEFRLPDAAAANN